MLTACSSTKAIPDDATAAQLIQFGQDSAGNGDYHNAERYYKTAITRYGTDSSVYIEARYELGHMYLQQKKYSEAYTSFKEIQDIFANAEAGILPHAYSKLADMEMAKIPESKRIKYAEQHNTPAVQDTISAAQEQLPATQDQLPAEETPSEPQASEN